MAEPEEDTAFPLKQQTQCPAQVVGTILPIPDTGQSHGPAGQEAA